jgi:predicted nucleic acid-binding protein
MIVLDTNVISALWTAKPNLNVSSRLYRACSDLKRTPKLLNSFLLFGQ